MMHRVSKSLKVGSFIFVLCATASSAEAGLNAAGFIQSLGNQTIGIIQNKALSQQDRKAAFSTLFKQDLDLRSISQSVLGQYWTTASPSEQAEFVSVFGDYLVSVYANKFANYSGVQFKISGEEPRGAKTTGVLSEIDPPADQAPIQVNWIVVDENGAFKIIDVEADRLSMGKMHKDEYASVIKNNGGKVQVLIDMLKAKMKED